MAMKVPDHTAEKSNTTLTWIRLLRSLKDPRVANSLLNINVLTLDFGLATIIRGGYLGMDPEWFTGVEQSQTVENAHVV